MLAVHVRLCFLACGDCKWMLWTSWTLRGRSAVARGPWQPSELVVSESIDGKIFSQQTVRRRLIGSEGLIAWHVTSRPPRPWWSPKWSDCGIAGSVQGWCPGLVCWRKDHLWVTRLHSRLNSVIHYFLSGITVSPVPSSFSLPRFSVASAPMWSLEEG